jgi:hypothetical protein
VLLTAFIAIHSEVLLTAFIAIHNQVLLTAYIAIHSGVLVTAYIAMYGECSSLPVQLFFFFFSLVFRFSNLASFYIKSSHLNQVPQYTYTQKILQNTHMSLTRTCGFAHALT